MSTEKVKRGLDIIRDLGIIEIVLSGGDPLLREDAPEIIEHASNLFVTTVYDNGSMATKKIEALRNGEDGRFVLTHCTTCFSCNLYCRNGRQPYQLILENWNRIYEERGAPPIYRFICPTMEGSIFQMLEKHN